MSIVYSAHLAAFTSAACPRCGAPGEFRWRFLGRLEHALCGSTWYMTFPFYWLGLVRRGWWKGFELAAADKKAEAWYGFITGALGAYFSGVFGLAFVPLNVIASLANGSSGETKDAGMATDAHHERAVAIEARPPQRRSASTRWLLLGGAAVLGAAVVWTLALRDRERSARAAVARPHVSIRRPSEPRPAAVTPAAQDSGEDLRGNLRELEAIATPREDASYFVTFVEGIVKRSRFTVRHLLPGPIGREGALAQFPVKVSGEATLDDLRKLLLRLSQGAKLLTVPQLEVKAGGSGPEVEITLTASGHALTERSSDQLPIEDVRSRIMQIAELKSSQDDARGVLDTVVAAAGRDDVRLTALRLDHERVTLKGTAPSPLALATFQRALEDSFDDTSMGVPWVDGGRHEFRATGLVPADRSRLVTLDPDTASPITFGRATTEMTPPRPATSPARSRACSSPK